MLEWSRDDLAKAGGVAKRTIVDFERGARSPQSSTLLAIRTALENAGVVFLDPNGNGPGVALARPVPPGIPHPDAPGRNGTGRDAPGQNDDDDATDPSTPTE